MTKKDAHVLVVDDEDGFGKLICDHLRHLGYRTSSAADCRQANTALRKTVPDLMLLDVHLPGMTGLEFLELLQREVRLPPTMIMSAYGDQEMALSALRAGALDFLSKPFRLPELELKIALALERARMEGDKPRRGASPKRGGDATGGGARLRQETKQDEQESFYGMIGRDPQMLSLFTKIERVARFSSTVMITGESGTGKELVARALHTSSPRAAGPFIAVNCGAIPENLLESELFGHMRGAFTDASTDRKGLFEQAHGGTLFLDEIVDLPLHLQVKLLRVLQQGEVRRVGGNRDIKIDVRVIAASAVAPRDMVAAGRFREDLFYRLGVIELLVPPLRERREDIPLLIRHVIAHANARLGTELTDVHPHAMARLMAWSWPGNVRELQNALEQACVMSEGEEITLDSLPSRLRADRQASASPGAGLRLPENSLSIPQAVREIERVLIEAALRRTEGNRTHAAELLQISQRSLLNKIRRYRIDIPGQPGRPPRR